MFSEVWETQKINDLIRTWYRRQMLNPDENRIMFDPATHEAYVSTILYLAQALRE